MRRVDVGRMNCMSDEGGSGWLLKGRPLPQAPPATKREERLDDAFGRIRCPRCEWRPSRSHRWTCYVGPNFPEPPFPACGTVWNTFETRGRCPGCAHQFIWTSCLRCAQPSLHEDWYERPPAAGPS